LQLCVIAKSFITVYFPEVFGYELQHLHRPPEWVRSAVYWWRWWLSTSNRSKFEHTSRWNQKWVSSLHIRSKSLHCWPVCPTVNGMYHENVVCAAEA